MCWTGVKSDLRIANIDIKVIKVLRKSRISGEVRSPIQDYLYEVGKVYKAKITTKSVRVTPENISVDEGLHCFSSKCPYYINKDNRYISIYIGEKTNIIKRILHKRSHCCKHNINAFNTDAFIVYTKLLIGTFIIPKGTKYYENEYGEIVTEKYIFTGYKEI